MFRTCLFCHDDLGTNEVLPTFPVGRRIAFDAQKGRLWVLCQKCGRWNLSPLDERWEAVEDCEREFRETKLRFSTTNIGLAKVAEGMELVRIGTPLRPEFAAWRYGRFIRRWLPSRPNHPLVIAADRALGLVQRVGRRLVRAIPVLEPRYDPLTWLKIHGQGARILQVAHFDRGMPAVVRFRHLEEVVLLRPDRRTPWRLRVRHDRGTTIVSGDAGLRTAAKLLAALNGWGASSADLRYALSKLEDTGDPDGYFSRVAALALRTSWGRTPGRTESVAVDQAASSNAERIALHLTTRSFWGRGGIGSEAETPLPYLPLPDRLALEMAANEETERRALEGELADLEKAWREAEEIAAIADSLLVDPLPSQLTRIHTEGNRLA